MNDLAQLKQRLSSAFEPNSANGEFPDGRNPVFDRFDQLHAPQELRPQVNEGDAAEGNASRALWLGGGGMMASALALSVGNQDAILFLAGALMASATLFMGYHATERVKAKRQARAERVLRERQADREWAEQEKESLLASIHDCLGDIALIRDQAGQIRAANSVFREIAGVADPVGRTCEELGFVFRPAQRAGRLLATIDTSTGPKSFAWGDVMVRDPATGTLVMQSVGRDITEESRSTSIAEAARLKAENASAAKSRLLATVAHEVRTPLTGLLGMADLLENSRLAADQKNYVAGLRQSGQVLSHLVEDLLDFATMEAGRFELRRGAEPPRKLIEGVVEMLASRAHFKGLEIASFVAPDVPEYLDLDAGRLRQVLFNVAGNAVKFTKSGGVSVSASMKGSDFVLVVRDTGPGMTAEERNRIFDEFVQVGPSHAKSGGKGLGLSISTRIIEAFGGDMKVDSIPGVGSSFTIRIPVSVDMLSFSPERRRQLAGSSVLLMAPGGPASDMIRQTITALGGECLLCEDETAVSAGLERGDINGRTITDIVVDHRLERQFIGDIAVMAEMQRLRRVFLVNPEERQTRISGPYDAWLIRPLREQSLVDVLRGRLRGMEKRGATNDNQPAQATGSIDAHKGLRILLGEDDPVNALLVQTTLERAGHSVRLAGDFDQLLDALWSPSVRRPDLVITDLGMPGGSGLDILAKIRNRDLVEGRRAIPLIVLSGDDADETRMAAFANGADRVLSKPAGPGELLHEVHATVNQATVGAGSAKMDA